MNSKLKISKLLKTMFTVFFVSFVFVNLSIGQLYSNSNISDEFRILDKIINEIKWDNDSKYLLYHNIGSLGSEVEENQDIEIWMVDLGCWNSNTSAEMNEVFCTVEFESDYAIENWMLDSYLTNAKTEIDFENEDDYNVESWMYDLQKFQDLD